MKTRLGNVVQHCFAFSFSIKGANAFCLVVCSVPCAFIVRSELCILRRQNLLVYHHRAIENILMLLLYRRCLHFLEASGIVAAPMAYC